MALGQRKPYRAINANYAVFAPSAGVTAFAREAALFVALAVAGAAHADPMVCRTEAGVTHCEAPINHYSVTGTDDRNELERSSLLRASAGKGCSARQRRESKK